MCLLESLTARNGVNGEDDCGTTTSNNRGLTLRKTIELTVKTIVVFDLTATPSIDGAAPVI